MKAILFFDLFATTFLLFVGIHGFKRGFIIEFGRLVGLIITIWLSIRYYIDLAEFLQLEVSANPFVLLFVSFFIILMVTFLITRILIDLIDKIIGVKRSLLFNQTFGFIIGIIKGAIPIAIILWTLELLPAQKWTETLYQESQVAQIVKAGRDKCVDLFGLDNPVNIGKDHIRKLIENDSRPSENNK